MLQIQKIEFESEDILDSLIPIYDTKHGKIINARELHFAL